MDDTQTGPDAEAREHHGHGVAVLLAASALLAAVLAGRSSFTSSNASSEWQSAVREQVKLAAATVENIRYVYGDQAPTAFRISLSGVVAAEARKQARAASGIGREALELEALAQRATKNALEEATALVIGTKYETPNGYDIPRFLGEAERQYPDLVRLDPGESQRRGDRESALAMAEVAVTVPVAVAFFFGALAQGFERRRRAFLAAGFSFLAVALALAVVVELTL